MEALDEVVAPNDHTHIVKGKRTKRQRLLSTFGVAMSTSSSSGGGVDEDDRSFPSPTTSAEFSESTEEEEDMANCLILLAQGQTRDGPRKIEDGGGMERFSTRKLAEPTTSKAGFYVYECKTCNRSFPSFQALGGHRASHKKPKAMLEMKKGLVLLSEDEGQFNNDSPPLPLQLGHRALYSQNKSRVHECSICGSEFSSGQALGGHMRRHRSSATTTTTMTMPIITSESQETKKPRHVLTLDLNLPAPEDDHRESKFPFGSKQQPLGFSASALVDCHY